MTVPQAAEHLGVSPRTAWRAVKNTGPEQIARDRIRLPAGQNRRMMLQLIVDVRALGRHLDGLRPGTK
jgi:hypothetical protein